MRRLWISGLVAVFCGIRSTWSIPRGCHATLFIFVVFCSACATTDDLYHGLDAKSRYYRVRKGDTLYGISQRVGRDFRSIAEWNGIHPPYRILEGQMVRLFPPPEHPPPKSPVKPRRISKKPSLPPKKPQKSRTSEKSFEKKLKVSWDWPLKGVIAKDFSQTGRKGLDIAGQYGAAVRAAADGRIVYCGQGLIGYGNLVIVKHNAHFLSAYGNNSRLLVQEGDFVKMGQRIAEVGLSTNKRSVLHFEIRKDGKPVDPIRHLPKP